MPDDCDEDSLSCTLTFEVVSAIGVTATVPVECALSVSVPVTSELMTFVPGIQGPPGDSNWRVTPTVNTAPTFLVNLDDYNYILFDCTANDIVVTLPDTSGIQGQSVVIKRLDGSDNTILIQDIGANFIYRQWDQGESWVGVVGNGQWLIT